MKLLPRVGTVLVVAAFIWVPFACVPTTPSSPPWAPPNPQPKGPQSPTATFTPTFTNTFCVACTPTFTQTSTNTPGPGTPSNTPTRTFTPSPTSTTSAGTPTFTPTPGGTVTLPMGLYVAANFYGGIINIMSFSMTITGAQVALAYNQGPYAAAAVTLTTPLNGSIALPWVQDIPLGPYTVSQYATGTQFSYVPNAVYSISVLNTPAGTAYSTMNAPGQISFNANGTTASAFYSGNLHQAVVSRTWPSPVTTFVSPAGIDVGSPYNYPATAYNSPSFPATFSTTYSAGLTIPTFTGTAGAIGGFIGVQSLSSEFTR